MRRGSISRARAGFHSKLLKWQKKHGRGYGCESLERRLLFISTSGIADWTSLGPSPTNQGQVRGMDAQFNPVSGAVAALAPHPTNPDVLYIASVNGGVWRTRDARDDFPNWQPLTDRFPTLSMGDITFDRADPSSQTLYAGIGVFSSSGGNGGTGSGILRTSDGGDTWKLLASAGPNSLAGERVEQLTANGNVVLAGGRNIGLFRSVDSGQSFNNVALVPGSGLPAGPCTGLVRDPGVAGRYYAAVVGGTGGVFVSNDSGLTWAPTNNGQLSGLGADIRLRLALHRNTAANTFALYVAIVANTGQLSGVFRSGDGTNWAAMDTPVTNEGGTSVGIFPGADDGEDDGDDEPGGQGGTHLSLEADPTNPNVVFIGGDRQVKGAGADGILGNADDAWPNSIGSTDFTARLFRGDASQPAGSQFTPITDNFASSTAPHADSRDIAFDAAGNMVESDDGGVYALINPNSAGRVWRARVGNLAITEFYSIAYDARLNRTIGGAQDTGAPESTIGSVVPGSSQWQDVLAADGFVAASDTTNPTTSYHYYENQNMNAFTWRSFDATGNSITNHPITLLVNNTAGGLALNSSGFDSLGFSQPYAVNAVDGTRMIIGTTFLYESSDRGDTLTSLGGLNAAKTKPANPVGQVTALAYGAAGNANLLYVGTSGATPLYIRTSGNGLPTASVAYPGSAPRDIALDPATGDAYVLDSNGSVWQTTNAGQTWNNLTGNLGTVPGDKRTIAVYRRGNAIRVLVGGQGGVFRANSILSGAAWEKFGRNLPHAPVNDLLYDVTSDQLIAGTLGRGAYVFRQASQLLTAQRFVTITADDVDEQFSVALHPTLPGFIAVTRTTATETLDILDLELSTFDGLVIDGRGGNDSLSIGLARPDLAFPITFIGGTGDDTLNLGIGRLNVLPNLITFDGVAGLNDRVNLFDQTNTTGQSYAITSDFVARSGFGGLRYFNLDRLVLNCGSGDDTISLTVGAILPLELHGNDGFDTIAFDDTANSTGRTWIINPEQVIIDGALTATHEFEGVAIRAGSGPDQINISGGHAQSFDIDAGGGSDTFTVGFLSQARFASSGGPVILKGGDGNDNFFWNNGSNNWAELIYGPFTDPLTLEGGAGFNTLSIDDTTRANTSYQFYPDRFYSFEPAVFPAGADFHYHNMGAIGLTCSNGSNPVAIYGTSSDIAAGNQISIVCNGGNDAVTLYPHDAQGNLTIKGTIGIGGGPGNDSITFDDTASSKAIAYSFSNPFGAGTQDVFGIGAAGVGYTSEFENAIFKAGGGNDTFAVTQYKSAVPLALYGGDGDDTLNLGGDNLPFNILMPSGSFLFDGQDGFDRFNLNNRTEISQWTYTANSLNVEANRGLPVFGYDTLFTGLHNEEMTVNAGPSADTFLAGAALPGTHSIFNGAGGVDVFQTGLAQIIQTLVKGKLTFNAGDPALVGPLGGGNVIVNAASTDPIRVHLTATTLGADDGDNLFGPGGSVEFFNATAVNLTLGDGADTVYAQPNASATISISGGNPTAAAGDTLNLALAPAVNYALHGTAASGSVTSDNLKTMTYSGFESGPNVDNTAPAVVNANINLNGIAPAAAANTFSVVQSTQQSIDIQFSEGVTFPDGAALELTDTTTGDAVPQAYIALSYDAGTQTAHYTFPGYPLGILPDGNYHGVLLANSTHDLFGNSLAADAPFDFFFLAGDANHDGTVNFTDLLTLAQNYGRTTATFAAGDFDYDGTVGFTDLLTLAQHYNHDLTAISGATATPLGGLEPTPGLADPYVRPDLIRTLKRPARRASPRPM